MGARNALSLGGDTAPSRGVQLDAESEAGEIYSGVRIAIEDRRRASVIGPVTFKVSVVQGQRPDTYQPRPKAWVTRQKEFEG